VPSDDFETESLPLLRPTVAVLTRDQARHATDCRLSIEPVELGAPDRSSMSLGVNEDSRTSQRSP
jgi:hypothetical protein